MKLAVMSFLLCAGLALGACSDSTPTPAVSDAPAPADAHGDLASAVQAPLDKAAGVNQLIDQQDAAQRRAMDAQGQ